MSTSEALGVWRRFIVRVEATAVAGEVNTDIVSEITSAITFIFIVR